MAQTIRTRKTHRDIKALDKTMTAAERMKNNYVRAKDSAGQAQGGEEQGSPVEYVGIVENVKKGVVNTIEGNSGDKVKRNSYPVGNDSIYGYGTPAYQ